MTKYLYRRIYFRFGDFCTEHYEEHHSYSSEESVADLNGSSEVNKNIRVRLGYRDYSDDPSLCNLFVLRVGNNFSSLFDEQRKSSGAR